MDEFKTKISNNRHRFNIWCDASVKDIANDAIRKINNGDAWTGDGYCDNTEIDIDVSRSQCKGYITGWSMTNQMKKDVFSALRSFMADGTVKIYPDEHGNIDSEGKELAIKRFNTKDILEIKKVKQRTRALNAIK